MSNQPRLTLVIANCNYSSWSLRPWLLMRHAGIAFTEHQILFSAAFHEQINRLSPAGRVPVLLDGELAVWDSLAIIEYLAEHYPQHGVWPVHPADRALARSICAEMHAGFTALRQQMPMNIEASLPGCGWDLRVQNDIDRIVSIWSSLRQRFAAQGPFLFGNFSAADAFFAPVVSRFTTYGVELPPECEAYRQAMLALPAMRAWTERALAEHHFVPEDEPYRRSNT